MMRHSSVLLIILIAYSAYCFGVMIPYENNTMLEFSARENLTITCTGTDEVTWKRSSSMRGKYTVIAESPRRQIFQVKNASVYHAGVYNCVSTNNSDDFMSIFLFPDDSCFEGIKMSTYHVPSSKTAIVYE
ncbi:uncharacterized protein LOC135846731 isoform X1 [Planococcus citri]|uniref:uncharacterized protein LOC135846731 isoform X1 n=1 Tax=Planococcus citri TaxID=170843 RepID=UPI0031F992BE